MVRYSSGDRVIYLHRQWKLSFVCFLAALGMIAVFWGTGAWGPDISPPIVFYPAAFLIVALILLCSRVLVIDAGRNSVLLEERRAFCRRRRWEFPLESVRLRTTSAEVDAPLGPGSRSFYVWIDVTGRPRIPLIGPLTKQTEVRDLVSSITRDLRNAGILPLPPEE